MRWVEDDGGRSRYFKGEAGDCVTRAIAIATGQDYKVVYDELAERMREAGSPRSARNGVPRSLYEVYLFDLGWIWHPTMAIGQGCKTHLREGEVPMEGPVIARLSRHVTAVVGGVIHDTFDPSRDGTRCVYGMYEPGLGVALGD